MNPLAERLDPALSGIGPLAEKISVMAGNIEATKTPATDFKRILRGLLTAVHGELLSLRDALTMPLPMLAWSTRNLLEASRDLQHDFQCLIDIQGPGGDLVLERLPVEPLHHEKIRADVVDRTDIWVVQLGKYTGLPLEALAEISAAGQLRVYQLNGDDPVEPRIPPAVHLSHAARTQRTQNFIGPELGARSQACAAPLVPRQACFNMAPVS